MDASVPAADGPRFAIPIRNGHLYAKYELHATPVGEGTFGCVYKAIRRRDGRTVAVKCVALDTIDEKARERCNLEVELAHQCSHNNIVEYVESFLDGSHLCLVTDYAAGGDLAKRFKLARRHNHSFSERVIWKYFAQLASVIEYLHAKRIMHRDVKPSNVLLANNGSLKVCDLGLGRLLSEDSFVAHSTVGSPLYVAPEIIRGEPYDFKTDIWSMGCILYEFTTLRSPFRPYHEGATPADVFDLVKAGEFAPIPDVYSPHLQHLITCMLQLDAADRPDATQVFAYATEINAYLASLASPHTVPITSEGPSESAVASLSSATTDGSDTVFAVGGSGMSAEMSLSSRSEASAAATGVTQSSGVSSSISSTAMSIVSSVSANSASPT